MNIGKPARSTFQSREQHIMKPWGGPTVKSLWSQNSVTDDVERYQRPEPSGS